MLGLRAPGAEGGIERVVASLAPLLVERGFAVTVWCRGGYAAEELPGVALRTLPAPKIRGFEALFHSAAALAPAALSADLLHLHAVGPGGLAPVARGLRCAAVVTWHGLDWRREKWGPLGRMALRAAASGGRHADALICVSREVWEQANHPRAVWIPNGVDPLPAPEGPPLFDPGYWLIVGRLAREKAVEVALDAHRRIPHAPPLLIAGSDAQDPGWAEALRRRAGPGVAFLGSRGRSDVGALVHGAAAVLFPSRLEGYPIALLEAVAAGRPVVASDIRPHREILGGPLVPVDDVEAWVKALSDLSTPIARVAARRAQVLDSAAWPAIADRTTAVYRAALARHGRGRRILRNDHEEVAEPGSAPLR
jgi:glycosyltransferase involved in cell wall biosynthesis